MIECEAVEALAALAEKHRLGIWRLLVRETPAGMRAGAIGEALGIPKPLLAYHLALLSRVGLARRRREGRFRIYTADLTMLDALTGLLRGASAPH